MKCDVDLYIAHVDDDFLMLSATNRLLKRRGIMTDMISNPKDLKSFKQDDISLILSDGTGIIDDTIKYRDLFLPDIPILLYSGDCCLVDEYKKFGIPGLVKPVPVDYLSSMIKYWVSKK